MSKNIYKYIYIYKYLYVYVCKQLYAWAKRIDAWATPVKKKILSLHTIAEELSSSLWEGAEGHWGTLNCETGFDVREHGFLRPSTEQRPTKKICRHHYFLTTENLKTKAKISKAEFPSRISSPQIHTGNVKRFFRCRKHCWRTRAARATYPLGPIIWSDCVSKPLSIKATGPTAVLPWK